MTWDLLDSKFRKIEIIRNKEHKPWVDYDDKADALFKQSYHELDGVLFNRVEKAKRIATSKVEHIRNNMCNSNSIVLSNVQKKRNIVSDWWWGVQHSISYIEKIKK